MERNSRNIWYEVNENTRKLMINKVDPKSQDIRFFKAVRNKRGEIIGNLKPPECVIINLVDHPITILNNLEDMPQNLPDLEVFSIRNIEIKSLLGIPKNLPNLKDLSFYHLKLNSLDGLPKFLPKLRKIFMIDTPLKFLNGLPSDLPSLEILRIRDVPLESLRYLPKSLPKLESIYFSKTNIQTLEFFPLNIPVLKEISFNRNKLVSLKGLPQEIPKLEEIYLSNNLLTSLEHFPSKFNKKKEPIYRKPYSSLKPGHEYLDRHINFLVEDNPIRTLTGIQYSFFFKAMVNIIFKRYRGSQLCPTALKLIKDYHEKKIRVGAERFNMTTNEAIHHEMIKDPKKYDAIVKFYSKTTIELAQQYIENLDSLSDGELERLGWEGGYQERQLLESNISLDNPLLKQISKRLTLQLPSGFSILK